MRLVTGIILSIITLAIQAQQSLPLFQISDMQYQGAFRLPAADYGNSDLNYSEGPIEYNPKNHSLFIVGHDHQQSIAEFSIPALVTGTLEQLNMGTNLQPFTSHLSAVACGNTQNINQIAGLKLIGGQLWVNAYEYYDADGNVTNTTLVIDNPAALGTSDVLGYFNYEGGAGHTAGWITEVPPVWQTLLGGSHLTGMSSGIPIISRCSVGPSAFSFNPGQMPLDCSSPQIPTTQLLDFSLANPLHDDLDNSSGQNDIWTHLSRATYGLIVPGTRTYLTVGYSGGHLSGVCYKCTQSDDNLCGGYCAPQADDYEQYYWLWDLNDLLAVKNGQKQAHEVTPYDYGALNTPIGSPAKEIGGGAFDPSSGMLYLTLQRADTAQGTYANPPVVIAYQISSPICQSCCVNQVFLSTSDVFSGMRVYSQDYLQSNAVIDALTNLQWKFSEYVEMIHPFEINLGSDLTIEMEECSVQ
ncbi:MAG: hypothetical protein HKN76_15495 [Saprospiraceae bacterium]|nr:hypothetical protein [Saprospiraceae bacterium]